MAGQLTIDSLKASSGVLATQNGMTGIAKAWVNFNGTGTVAIRSSFNVSSITDNGSGDYTVNFTTAMPNASYATVGTSNGDSGGICCVRSSIYSTTQVRINTYYATFNLEDSSIVSVAILSS